MSSSLSSGIKTSRDAPTSALRLFSLFWRLAFTHLDDRCSHGLLGLIVGFRLRPLGSISLRITSERILYICRPGG